MNIRNNCLYIWYRYIGAIFRLIPIEKNKVVFTSYFGKGYGDNPKYVAEQLKVNKDLKLVWLLKKGQETSITNNVEIVKRGTIAELYHLATASVWVDNSRKHAGVLKRKKQYYVQTWHGCIALKKIEGDVEDKLEADYIKSAKQDSKQIDLMVSNGKWCTEMYRRAFWYKGEILECGTPRMDALISINDKQKRNIKQSLGLPLNTNILLYAPTFRKNQTMEVYELPYEKIKESLEEKFGGQWIVLNRLHPSMSNYSFSNNLTYCYDVTKYPDMYELLAVSDILITDYSSTMFEMGFNKKIVFLYATDWEEYSKEDRGFYFELDKLPYSFSQTQEELIENIKSFDSSKYQKKCTEFQNLLGVKEDGRSSNCVAQKILRHINESR